MLGLLDLPRKNGDPPRRRCTVDDTLEELPQRHLVAQLVRPACVCAYEFVFTCIDVRVSVCGKNTSMYLSSLHCPEGLPCLPQLVVLTPQISPEPG